MRLTLCLLTWNELAGCRHDIPLLPLDKFEEVYAIDGGSSDGTVDYLKNRGIPVYTQDTPGYNGAYISAFRRCTTDALVIFHPKNTIEPGQVLKFRPFLEQGYDFVVGSRMRKGGRNEEDNKTLKPRKWFVIFLGYIARIIWRREGNRITDVLHGFRAMRKDTFFSIGPSEHGLSVDLEMVIRSYRKAIARIEFPVVERPRPSGHTHFKALPTGMKLLRSIWDELHRPCKLDKVAWCKCGDVVVTRRGARLVRAFRS